MVIELVVGGVGFGCGVGGLKVKIGLISNIVVMVDNICFIKVFMCWE